MEGFDKLFDELVKKAKEIGEEGVGTVIANNDSEKEMDFASFAKTVIEKLDNMAETISRQNEIIKEQSRRISELEILKGRVEMVDDQTAAFSSEQMREIYKTLMPDIRREINELYKKVEGDMEEMVEIITGNQGKILGNTDRALSIITKNLNEHTRTLSARISSAEDSVKGAIPGKSKGFAFQ